MRRKQNNDLNKYLKVVTNKQNDEAEMFLFGYIGQDFWWDEELNEESITDLAFVKALRDLEKDYKRINIRINSPGGSVLHGDPIVSAIRESKSEIHTYVSGIAASMAADIWLSGDVRHMSLNSKLMIHATSSIEFGTAKQMRQAAERLDKFDDAAIAVFAAATGMDETEIRERFYDYEDHWLTAKDVLELGLIDAIEDYEVATTVQEPEKMSYQELLRQAVLEAKREHGPKPEKQAKTKKIEAQKEATQETEETEPEKPILEDEIEPELFKEESVDTTADTKHFGKLHYAMSVVQSL